MTGKVKIEARCCSKKSMLRPSRRNWCKTTPFQSIVKSVFCSIQLSFAILWTMYFF